MKEKCPCGCGLDVPQRASNCWQFTEPYWEWLCISPACERRDTRMQNQSGDETCSWCGSRRMFVGHFRQGSQGKSGRRRTVLGEWVVMPAPHHLVKRTPKHLIRPFQDVT